MCVSASESVDVKYIIRYTQMYPGEGIVFLVNFLLSHPSQSTVSYTYEDLVIGRFGAEIRPAPCSTVHRTLNEAPRGHTHAVCSLPPSGKARVSSTKLGALGTTGIPWKRLETLTVGSKRVEARGITAKQPFFRTDLLRGYQIQSLQTR
jgi:hypothetical protein